MIRLLLFIAVWSIAVEDFYSLCCLGRVWGGHLSPVVNWFVMATKKKGRRRGIWKVSVIRIDMKLKRWAIDGNGRVKVYISIRFEFVRKVSLRIEWSDLRHDRTGQDIRLEWEGTVKMCLEAWTRGVYEEKLELVSGTMSSSYRSWLSKWLTKRQSSTRGDNKWMLRLRIWQNPTGLDDWTFKDWQVFRLWVQWL